MLRPPVLALALIVAMPMTVAQEAEDSTPPATKRQLLDLLDPPSAGKSVVYFVNANVQPLVPGRMREWLGEARGDHVWPSQRPEHRPKKSPNTFIEAVPGFDFKVLPFGGFESVNYRFGGNSYVRHEVTPGKRLFTAGLGQWQMCVRPRCVMYADLQPGKIYALGVRPGFAGIAGVVKGATGRSLYDVSSEPDRWSEIVRVLENHQSKKAKPLKRKQAEKYEACLSSSWQLTKTCNKLNWFFFTSYRRLYKQEEEHPDSARYLQPLN